MSRGPGRVERVILAAMRDEPTNAFTIDDLCVRAFLGANRIEKKHRVSLLRALHTALTGHPTHEVRRSSRRGNAIAVVNAIDPMSHATARLKMLRRFRYGCEPEVGRQQPASEAYLRSLISEGGERHADTLAGGFSFLLAAIARADRDGDMVLGDALRDQLRDRRYAALKMSS